VSLFLVLSTLCGSSLRSLRLKAFDRKGRQGLAKVAKKNCPKKTKSSFPGIGKEAQEVLE
jgi:hypothetical protein